MMLQDVGWFLLCFGFWPALGCPWCVAVLWHGVCS